ncbi:MAG: COX15/CtaA family protein [Rhodospirillales bacterium]|jgi:cytochrome c oxidase assembly protein subunit 15|nr:heme A synthase [Rhodospirillaceae bacterium]MDP6429210.1 COX15/CtaA family protein [Rhodospirillales bacterium]MDP6840439.1 COX15/CtaA family protein [Rhodospirillales bacterium]
MQLADSELRAGGDGAAEHDAAQLGAAERNARKLGVWLLVLVGMVFVMVVLGGLTRLTGSGLSMVDWRPVTGWLPPITDAEWRAVFGLYREIPQYREINEGMTLDGFKSIFWLEYVHRLWGRLIGLAFALPFLYFLYRRLISRKMAPWLISMFILGGLQGVLGWYMVKSGLALRTDVSQYRLTAHLVAAMLIYGYMLWVALSLLRGPGGWRLDPANKGLAWFTAIVAACIALTMTSGGFVAGLDAGLTYNTFPLMDGSLVPHGLFIGEPAWLNLFENITTVQFDHRLLAEVTVILVLALWIYARRRLSAGIARTAFDLMALLAVLQLALGIVTLLLVVPVALAATHQAGAFILLALSIWAVHALGSSALSNQIRSI